jgi:hypothetical protein
MRSDDDADDDDDKDNNVYDVGLPSTGLGV